MDTETDDAGSATPESRPRPYFWTLTLALTTTLALMAAVLLWRRAKHSANRLPTEQRPAQNHAAAFGQTHRGQADPDHADLGQGHSTQALDDQAPVESNSPYRARTGRSSTTPATPSWPATKPPPQRQPKPTDGLKVDWHHDVSDNPDWQRVFGGRAKTETPETPLDSEKLPAAYLEDPPKAYVPKSPEAAARASAETAKLTELDTAILTELDTTTLPEQDAATLLETATVKLPPVEESPADKPARSQPPRRRREVQGSS